MELIHFLIFCLATWRTSSLLVNEAGPWDVFLRLRKLMGIQHDQQKRITIIPDGFFASLFSCIWCISLWVGFGWIFFSRLAPFFSLALASGMAFSAVAIVIQSYLER